MGVICHHHHHIIIITIINIVVIISTYRCVIALVSVKAASGMTEMSLPWRERILKFAKPLRKRIRREKETREYKIITTIIIFTPQEWGLGNSKIEKKEETEKKRFSKPPKAFSCTH